MKVPGGNSFQDSLRYLNAKNQPLIFMGFNVWMTEFKTLVSKLLKKQSKVQTYNIVKKAKVILSLITFSASYF